MRLHIVATAVGLLLVAACSGAGSGGTSDGGSGSTSGFGSDSSAGNGTVYCQGGGPGRDYCLCGAEVTATDPNLVTQCSPSTLQSTVGVCCALNNAAKDCVCSGYVCSFPQLDNTMDCACQWGQEFSSMTTQSCTDSYCCQAPATSVLGGSCSCGTTPCSSGTTAVPQCGLGNPAPACPPGATQVTSCR